MFASQPPYNWYEHIGDYVLNPQILLPGLVIILAAALIIIRIKRGKKNG